METHGRIPQTAERLFLVFSGILVLLIGIMAYNSDAAFRRDSDQAVATRTVAETTNALLSSLKDAETGQRGFLLTGEDSYLEPYRRALTEIGPSLDTLARIESERHRQDQLGRLERLRPLVKEKLGELARTIDLRRNQDPDAALAEVRTGRGQTLMEQIRALCAEIRTVSYDSFNRERQKARARANQTALIAIVGSAGIFTFLLFATVSVERGTYRRQQLIRALEKSEEHVRQSRDWLQTTLASIADAVITTDDTGSITLLNPVAQSLTGWTNEEAYGKPLAQIFVIRNEETGREVENPVTKVLRGGRIAGLANHTKLISKDGRHIPIDDSAAPIRAQGGEAAGKIGGVVLVFRDITARREIETRLAEQAAELRRIAHLLEPVACFVRDLDDRIVYWNPGAAELYGFSAQEALGQISHALFKTEFDAPLEEILAQFRTAGIWEGELLHTRRDGSRITVASHWTLHRDTDGRPAATLECNIDITRRKTAEGALRIANAALLRANEDLNQFAFAASHDLQEPLRMITSYSQLLFRGFRGQLDGEAATCIQFITEGTRRMRQLLADLLAYTQIAGDAEQPVGPVDLNRVFETTLEDYRAAIEETQAAVTSDRLPTVQGYEPHLVQLFQNLIGNGLKYRAELPPRIHVSAEKQDGLWRVAVKDNGIGIAPEFHRQIFGVFKRLQGRSIPGTGIGLAICQRVVERYGGRIWVESQTGQGACFYFTLLAAPGEPHES